MNMVIVPVGLMAVRSLEKSMLPVNRYLEPSRRLWCELRRLTGHSCLS
jgi:hypothetical protein